MHKIGAFYINVHLLCTKRIKASGYAPMRVMSQGGAGEDIDNVPKQDIKTIVGTVLTLIQQIDFQAIC